MKISNSKKQLAKIINENGGWREGAKFAWFGNKTQRGYFGVEKPVFNKQSGAMVAFGRLGWEIHPFTCKQIPNWHQTILSRGEYFYLYPAPVKEVVESPEQRAKLAEIYKPSIEQLAANYRNAKDYAKCTQQEADAAKADAEAKLAVYVAAAGSAVGLVLSVGLPEPELVITDWRQLRENDWIWSAGGGEIPAGEYRVLAIEVPDYGGRRTVLVDTIGDTNWIDTDEEWRFIRRPAKGAPNA